MSGPKWTPAQQAAIADRGGALLVSAAAGSGKTAVLTERAVQLITDPARPVNADRQLIGTDTKAAAAEQRGRQQRQRVPLLRRDVRFVHPFAQAVVHRSPGGAVNIPRLAGAQNKTSILRSYSSIIRPFF